MNGLEVLRLKVDALNRSYWEMEAMAKFCKRDGGYVSDQFQDCGECQLCAGSSQ